MWQVSGRSEIIDFDEVVKLDKYYIENGMILMLQLLEVIKYGITTMRNGLSRKMVQSYLRLMKNM